MLTRSLVFAALATLACACRNPTSSAAPSSGARANAPTATASAPRASGVVPAASLPLVLVAEVDLPGRAVRFDYQDLDAAASHLVIAHMNDDSVVVVSSRDGSLVKVLPGITTPRGVAVATDAGRIFVTSMPNKLVIIDSHSLGELARVDTGRAPDGVAWDPAHRVVGVSAQGDGAISLIADSGRGTRNDVALGSETGNVAYDASRAAFWITVVTKGAPDRLVAVDPVAAKQTTSIPLPGCSGAHGLRIHPDGRSAFVACEDNSKIARVALDGGHVLELAAAGADPDVLALDPSLGWLYVAAESGDLKVFDLKQPGLALLGSEHSGKASHSVAVDPATHHVFFPLLAGPKGTPVLRIMRPTGT
jgi:DNA-binding beta-propeller fold protein YncE